jgi:AraC-like DNA-binding protein
MYQVCFPYQGLGVWHVGGEDVLADANQVLFVRGGETYRVSGPVAGGYAELILTPDVEILSQIAATGRAGLFDHPLFRGRRRRATPAVQSLRATFQHLLANGSAASDLEAEELVVALLRAALDAPEAGAPPCGPATARLIRKAKEFLQERLPRPVRLVEVASAVGASPAYLTDVFRRVEGVPLHRYLVQLRLARALPELPHTDDLTTLALRLGFSSHSHFSAAFRRAFGYTPSQFRDSARSLRRARVGALTHVERS